MSTIDERNARMRRNKPFTHAEIAAWPLRDGTAYRYPYTHEWELMTRAQRQRLGRRLLAEAKRRACRPSTAAIDQASLLLTDEILNAPSKHPRQASR